MYKIKYEFGTKMLLLKFLSIVYPYAKHKNKFGEKIFCEKNNEILKILGRENRDLFIKWQNVYSKSSGDTVWTFWWQGLELAPESVKRCISNMKKYAGDKKVVVISKDNIQEYLDLQPIIYEKLEQGIISITHLSDIIRVNLLYKFGGLWLDGGVYPVHQIDGKIFNKYYWSRKGKSQGEAHITDSRWCVGISSGKPGGGYYGFMVDAFDRYWNDHNVQLDYFLIDYLNEIAYQNMKLFKNAVDILEISSPRLYSLEKELNKPEYDKEDLKKLISENDFLRLQWRKTYQTSDIHGNKTLYGQLFCG